MKDVIRRYIDKVLIPKYGELNYELSGINSVNVKYSDLPFNEIHNIIEDTKLILSMLGLHDVRVTKYNREPWHIIITGYH